MEGYCLTVVEAAAAGTPVVAARLEGIQDAVIDNITGVFVTPADAEGYVETIRHFIEDPEMRREFARNAAQVARQDKTWSASIAQYATALHGLLENGQQPISRN